MSGSTGSSAEVSATAAAAEDIDLSFPYEVAIAALGVTKKATPSEISAKKDVLFTIDVTNLGSIVLESLYFLDDGPEEFVYRDDALEPGETWRSTFTMELGESSFAGGLYSERVTAWARYYGSRVGATRIGQLEATASATVTWRDAAPTPDRDADRVPPPPPDSRTDTEPPPERTEPERVATEPATEPLLPPPPAAGPAPDLPRTGGHYGWHAVGGLALSAVGSWQVWRRRQQRHPS